MERVSNVRSIKNRDSTEKGFSRLVMTATRIWENLVATASISRHSPRQVGRKTRGGEGRGGKDEKFENHGGREADQMRLTSEIT